MSSSSVRRAIENEVAWSWKDWMGITSEQSPQAVPGSASAEPARGFQPPGFQPPGFQPPGFQPPGFQPPGFQPEEALALYREVFDALQVPRRLSGARRLRRGPFEIASEIFPAQFFSGDFVSVFDSCDEGVEKPDPRFFRLALDRVGADAASTVHVGDLFHVDVVGARAACIEPVLLDVADLYGDADCLRVRSLSMLPDVLRSRAG